MWYGVTEDGIWYWADYAFKTKADIIHEITCAKDDPRKNPVVNRVSAGHYVYKSHNNGEWVTIISDEYIAQHPDYKWVLKEVSEIQAMKERGEG